MRLGSEVTDETIRILSEHGLRNRYSAPFNSWNSRETRLLRDLEAQRPVKLQEAKDRIRNESGQLRDALEYYLINHVLQNFPLVWQSAYCKNLICLTSLSAGHWIAVNYEHLILV